MLTNPRSTDPRCDLRGFFDARHTKIRAVGGAGEGSRTPDLSITNRMLCRLSYSGGSPKDNSAVPCSVCGEAREEGRQHRDRPQIARQVDDGIEYLMGGGHRSRR